MSRIIILRGRFWFVLVAFLKSCFVVCRKVLFVRVALLLKGMLSRFLIRCGIFWYLFTGIVIISFSLYRVIFTRVREFSFSEVCINRFTKVLVRRKFFRVVFVESVSKKRISILYFRFSFGVVRFIVVIILWSFGVCRLLFYSEYLIIIRGFFGGRRGRKIEDVGV